MTTSQQRLPEGARYCADTFNGAIASAALSAAWEIGLLDELDQKRRVDIVDFAERRDAHPHTVRAILVALSSRRIVTLDAERRVAETDIGFDDAFRARAFFYWLTRGCGELLTTLPVKVVNSLRQGGFVRRDARALSVACRNITQTYFDPPLRDMLEKLEFGTVADLGCGGGERLRMLAALRTELRLIGVDRSASAISLAREAVREAGFADRVTLLQDDLVTMGPRPEYGQVDTVTCFLMGHDLWPRQNCVRTLRRLRTVFPSARNLILGDTCRSTGLDGPEHPMFTLGFETVHSVMGQLVPTIDEWSTAIEESGWRIVDRRLLDVPAFSFIDVLTPA
ncbi:class I SAM-dependent methyltransferase [Streptomyces sp. NPDC127098]|uniref:class I SAM-dependent methyltransferase n=1 Tax=Streptomyces sp. NPDC127098 TaxID=3347137 RepID=UPI0036650DE1